MHEIKNFFDLLNHKKNSCMRILSDVLWDPFFFEECVSMRASGYISDLEDLFPKNKLHHAKMIGGKIVVGHVWSSLKKLQLYTKYLCVSRAEGDRTKMSLQTQYLQNGLTRTNAALCLCGKKETKIIKFFV